jgi:N,N'-diacetyllegionaminate synthase
MAPPLADPIEATRHDPTEPSRGITIGATRIGPGRPVYVIAEAGVNHNGSLSAALALVDAAAEAGANAVKFQIFQADQLVTRDAATANYQESATGATSQHEMLRRLELTVKQFAALRDRCLAAGLEFLATPFSSSDLRALTGLGVRAIKIASTDLNNAPLLDDAGRTGLPLILSTGASDAEEIGRAVGRLRSLGAGDRLVLLHCVSSYPTRWEDANLRAIGHLRRRFGLPVGFSDHTTSVDTGALAVAAGACVLEKHFTLDRSQPGPDQALSLEPEELADYVARVRRAEQALGTGSLDVQDSEREVRRIARKSVVAALDLAAGDVLEPSRLTTKRPAGGIAPDQMDGLIGRRAAVPIPADTVITWEMVE